MSLSSSSPRLEQAGQAEHEHNEYEHRDREDGQHHLVGRRSVGRCRGRLRRINHGRFRNIDPLPAHAAKRTPGIQGVPTLGAKRDAVHQLVAFPATHADGVVCHQPRTPRIHMQSPRWQATTGPTAWARRQTWHLQPVAEGVAP
jgi:hypothetical protein